MGGLLGGQPPPHPPSLVWRNKVDKVEKKILNMAEIKVNTLDRVAFACILCSNNFFGVSH